MVPGCQCTAISCELHNIKGTADPDTRHYLIVDTAPRRFNNAPKPMPTNRHERRRDAALARRP